MVVRARQATHAGLTDTTYWISDISYYLQFHNMPYKGYKSWILIQGPISPNTNNTQQKLTFLESLEHREFDFGIACGF
jgi:hypothetical protein